MMLRPTQSLEAEPLRMAEQEALELAGYASRFEQTDLSGDRVERGAFAGSLISQAGPLPMLYNHQTDTPIGVWDEAFEDETGLFVRGRLFLGTPEADRAARLIASGSVSGLSIGFRTQRFAARADGGRNLFDLELWEVSIVAFPMLPSARLTEIGSDMAPGSTPPDDNIQPPQANEITRSL